MPSVQSLAHQEYYANPRNSFWWLMSEICGFSYSFSYPERVEAIKKKGVAIWDVLYDCERLGSADSKIVPSSTQLNDLESFLLNHPSLKLVAFNGATAENLFKSRYASVMNQDFSFKTLRLPSSSPAYAAMPKAVKLEKWASALTPVLQNG